MYNSSELFSLITAPLFLKIGSCRASRSARTDFFLLIFSLNRFFFRDCATFGFRHSCNHFETVVTSKQNFYLLFSRYKKSPNLWRERGLLMYMLITCENVNMQKHYRPSSKPFKGLRDAN